MREQARLLYLAYAFPPLAATGSVRAWNTAKYLRRLGWEVTVVTPHPALWSRTWNASEVEDSVAGEGIRRILTGHRWRMLNPGYLRHWDHGLGVPLRKALRAAMRGLGWDGAIGWKAEASNACSHLVPGDADVILATGDPFISFELAGRLSDRLGCPFVLDYRDLWTNNPVHRVFSPWSRAMRTERRLLNRCADVTIVSLSSADALQCYHWLPTKPKIVTNGYDPEEFAAIRPHAFDHFAIVYAGVFYPPTSTITPVMAALQRLARKDISPGITLPWRFHYYGPAATHVLESAKQSGIRDLFVNHGTVSRAEALSAIRGAGITVVITSVNDVAGPAEKGIVTAKLFDALGAGSRVLLVVAPPGSDAASIIESSGSGCRFSGSDVAGIASYLQEAIAGRVPRPSPPLDYAWPTIAKRFDAILRGAIRSHEKTGRLSGACVACDT